MNHKPPKPDLGAQPQAWADYRDAHRRWARHQAETSRAGAIEHATTDDPDGLLLHRLTDHELDVLREHGHRLATQLADDGEDAPARYVWIKLCGPVTNRMVDLHDATYAARAAIDGNGHVANIAHDPVMGERDGTPWTWWCSCDATEPRYFATRSEAVDSGGRHIAGHGGTWAHDLSE